MSLRDSYYICSRFMGHHIMKYKQIRLLTLFFLCCVFPVSLLSQVFSGKVINESKEPVPYATLYIKELTSGFVTNDKGYFQTTLPAGTYTCEVSSLGYTNQTFTIHLSAQGLEKEIILSERVYELKEVSITRNNEDPAYAVMRKAIAYAPFYRTYVKTYTADTYLKGTGKLKHVPAVFKLSKDVRKETKKYLDKLLVMEEERSVTYTAPNSWKNEIKAYTNTFPEDLNLEIRTTNINLYQPKLFGKVSPLSPGALSYYHFKLEGCYPEGDHLINKIKIIPKKGNKELISGYLYVVENLWCLSAADIFLDERGVKATIKIACNEVKPSAFLTTSLSLNTTIDIMGVKAEASYLSSIRYAHIELEKGGPVVIAPQKDAGQQSAPAVINKKQQKTKEKIDKLLEKEELSTREAYQLSKLVAKSVEQADTTRKEHRFEKGTRKYTSETDSLASKRDSVYWAAVRSVPLKPEEQQSYAHKDKIELKRDSAGSDTTGKSGIAGTVVEAILFGKAIQAKERKAWLITGGIFSHVPEYNFVDGLWIGAKPYMGLKLSDYSNLYFYPKVYYTTSRKKWIAYGALGLEYAPRRMGHLSINGGILSADYNGESGESRLVNSIASYLFGRNDIKLYDKRYLSVNNDIELLNSLLLSTGFVWEKRRTLDNTIDKGFFKVKAKPNVPNHPDFTPMPGNELLKLNASLAFTPAHYYRMIRGKKYYERSAWPTFTLHYERAFPHGGEETLSPSYHKAELSIEHKFGFGMFNSISWYVNGGTFWDKEEMQFPDFKHFSTTRLPVTEGSFEKGFSLADNYAYSTDTRWAQANVTWYTPYLLLKHLPFLKRERFDEAFHLRSLIVYDRRPYTEAGYSIGWSGMARFGVFAGFERLKYKSVGISVSIPLMEIVGY